MVTRTPSDFLGSGNGEEIGSAVEFLDAGACGARQRTGGGSGGILVRFGSGLDAWKDDPYRRIG